MISLYETATLVVQHPFSFSKVLLAANESNIMYFADFLRRMQHDGIL